MLYTRDGQLIDQGPDGALVAVLYGFWEGSQAYKIGGIYGFKMNLQWEESSPQNSRASHPAPCSEEVPARHTLHCQGSCCRVKPLVPSTQHPLYLLQQFCFIQALTWCFAMNFHQQPEREVHSWSASYRQVSSESKLIWVKQSMASRGDEDTCFRSMHLI